MAAAAAGDLDLQDLCLGLRHLAEVHEQLGYGTLDTTPYDEAGKPRRRSWWG